MSGDTKRLAREDWLEGGLEALSREGVPGLRTERLAAQLGVTTGSYYWHFRNRADFERQLLSHWRQGTTVQLVMEMEREGMDPEQQLQGTLANVIKQRLARYETPIRAWALNHPRAREAVAEVDRMRLDYIAGLLRRLGFDGDALNMRARMLLLYVMAEPSFFVDDSEAERLRWLHMRVELAVQGAPARRRRTRTRAGKGRLPRRRR